MPCSPWILTAIVLKPIADYKFASASITAQAGPALENVKGDQRDGGLWLTAYGFTLFDTAIGPCGVAWSDRGLVGYSFPKRAKRRRESHAAAVPGRGQIAPPRNVQLAIDNIVALLCGEPSDSRQSSPTWRTLRRFTAASTRWLARYHREEHRYGDSQRDLGRQARLALSAKRSAKAVPDHRAVSPRAGGRP